MQQQLRRTVFISIHKILQVFKMTIDDKFYLRSEIYLQFPIISRKSNIHAEVMKVAQVVRKRWRINAG